ncbi:FRG domain-containing protein, partial [Leptospira sp. SA-E8]|uniref:FRG domain-containing protein n=1 Tax=Leptospira sp. SA-E8 TaxID=3422259 RepID=UPI003EBC5784
MKSVHCKSLEELKAAIDLSGPDGLFRGQTRHFQREDGSPSLTTTFSRYGCIPDLMIRWQHYACEILKKYVKGRTDTPDLATDQAVLQHYGWRSFFLDATGDAKVAAWFASNEYRSSKIVNFVEDCFEDPVSLISEMGSFERAKGMGHLYVLSRKMIRHSHIEAVHLSEIATNTGNPRYVCQDAYMVGPIDPLGLAIDCIGYHITATSDVLAAYAQGLTLETLF